MIYLNPLVVLENNRLLEPFDWVLEAEDSKNIDKIDEFMVERGTIPLHKFDTWGEGRHMKKVSWDYYDSIIIPIDNRYVFLSPELTIGTIMFATHNNSKFHSAIWSYYLHAYNPNIKQFFKQEYKSMNLFNQNGKVDNYSMEFLGLPPMEVVFIKTTDKGYDILCKTIKESCE